MGLPQGSIIAPLLFNILMNDLPSHLSKHVVLVQYADDICIWMNVIMKRNTSKRALNYIKKLYQRERDKINNYMIINGLELSSEKTHMMLFNNGSNPAELPLFKIGNKQFSTRNR